MALRKIMVIFFLAIVLCTSLYAKNVVVRRHGIAPAYEIASSP